MFSIKMHASECQVLNTRMTPVLRYRSTNTGEESVNDPTRCSLMFGLPLNDFISAEVITRGLKYFQALK